MAKTKDYTYNILFFALCEDGEYDIEGDISQNKAVGELLLRENTVTVEDAYELDKAIFGEEDSLSFEDFEDDYTRDDMTRIVRVTAEMVDTINKKFEKARLDKFPERECIAIIYKIK